MKIHSLTLHPFKMSLKNGLNRSGVWIRLADEQGNEGWGECSPLPNWSSETLEECMRQLNSLNLIATEWEEASVFQSLAALKLFPATLFGLESALLSLMKPLVDYKVKVSALFHGSQENVLQQAKLRKQEGYTSAKLKVSQFSFEEAKQVIEALQEDFRLRIDVNRKWRTQDSLDFFSQFALDAFDYVEEPFQDPHDLKLFPLPLAVDESFPHDLSFEELAMLPTLKALIYKPTIQGGMTHCFPLLNERFSLVLSSSYESALGLRNIAAMAHRLSLTEPIGIGTYHYIKVTKSVIIEGNEKYSHQNAELDWRCRYGYAYFA